MLPLTPVDPLLPVQQVDLLTAIRVLPTIRHAQYARSRMLQRRRDLILEFPAGVTGRRVDGGAATTRARWVTGLQHEGGDDAVEEDVGVVAALGESGEIFACLQNAALVGCIV